MFNQKITPQQLRALADELEKEPQETRIGILKEDLYKKIYISIPNGSLFTAQHKKQLINDYNQSLQLVYKKGTLFNAVKDCSFDGAGELIITTKWTCNGKTYENSQIEKYLDIQDD